MPTRRIVRAVSLLLLAGSMAFDAAGQDAEKPEKKGADYSELDRLVEVANGDDEAAARSAANDLVSALDDESWGWRIAAAKRLGACPDRDTLVPILLKRFAAAEKRARAIMKDGWLSKPPKKWVPRVEYTTPEKFAEESSTAPFAAALATGLAATADPRAIDELQKFAKRYRPTKCPYVILEAVVRALCAKRDSESMQIVLSALRSVEKLIDKPLDKQPYPDAAPRSMGMLFAMTGRPPRSKDFDTLVDIVSATFEAAGVPDLPTARKERRSTNRWKGLFRKHKSLFATGT